MTKWNATMPREKPKSDYVHFVLAVKSADSRHEMAGQISVLKAKLIFKLANMRDESLLETIGDLLPDNAMYRAKPAYETHIHRQALVHRRALDQLLLARLRGDLI